MCRDGIQILTPKSSSDYGHGLDTLETLGGEVGLPSLGERGASGEAVGVTPNHERLYLGERQ